jgi:hypothetical protein
MTVRHFTRASQEYLTFAPGSALNAVDSDVMTVAWIWRPASVHAGCIVYGADAAGGGSRKWAVNEYSDGNTWFGTDSDGQITGSYTADDEWLLNASANNVAGSDRRAHRYNFTDETWSHTDPGGSVAKTAPGTLDHVRVGRMANSATEYLDGDLAVLAIFDSYLSDGNMETLTSGLSAWVALSPVALWAFNQADTSDDVLDLTGNGADQTAITGTTVVTGDDPPGFSFGLGQAGNNRVFAPGIPIRSGG